MNRTSIMARARKLLKERTVITEQKWFVLMPGDPEPEGENIYVVRLRPSKPQDDPHPKRTKPAQKWRIKEV